MDDGGDSLAPRRLQCPTDSPMRIKRCSNHLQEKAPHNTNPQKPLVALPRDSQVARYLRNNPDHHQHIRPASHTNRPNQRAQVAYPKAEVRESERTNPSRRGLQPLPAINRPGPNRNNESLKLRHIITHVQTRLKRINT